MTQNQNNPFIIPPETIEEEARQKTFWERLNFPRSWLVVIVAVIVAMLSLMAWTLLWRNLNGGQPKVALWFDTSSTITSGSASEFSLVYENQESGSLENASLEIVYPDSFRFLASQPPSSDGSGRQFYVGGIPAGKSGIIKLTGIFTGSPQEVQLLRGKIFFQQRGSSASFSQSADSPVSLQAPDFNLRITAPAQVVENQRVDYVVSFQNISDTDLGRVQIRLTYPPGLKFISADLPSADNAVWEKGRMKVGDEARLNLAGTLAGSPGEDKTLQADVGYINESGAFILQSRTFSSVRILASPLTVTVKLATPGSIDAGGGVSYQITYKNTGAVGMSNVKLVLHLAENAVDYSTLHAESGALVGKDIIWNPAGVPALRLLQPQAEGALTLGLSTRRDLSDTGVKNPMVHTTIAVSSNELPEPVSGGETMVKVRSALAVSASSEYVSGASPLRSGEESVYRVRFRLKNTVNPVAEAAFSAVLNIPAADVIVGSESFQAGMESFRFNPASGLITWHIGRLDAFSVSEVDFLVRVTPSAVDRTTGLLLVKAMQAAARDEFTGDEILAQTSGDLELSQ